MTNIELKPIAAVPTVPGTEFGPCLVAPGEAGGWTLAAWDGRAWFGVNSARS